MTLDDRSGPSPIPDVARPRQFTARRLPQCPVCHEDVARVDEWPTPKFTILVCPNAACRAILGFGPPQRVVAP